MPVVDERTRRILQERAKELAARGQLHDRKSTGESVAVLHVGAETLALPVRHLKSVIRVPPITPVPGHPAWLVGILQAEGMVISAIDLAPWLGVPLRPRLPAPQVHAGLKQGYIALLEFRQRFLGLLLDTVAGVREIFLDEIIDKQASERAAGALPVRWVTRDLVTVLDIERLFELADRRSTGSAVGPTNLTKEIGYE